MISRGISRGVSRAISRGISEAFGGDALVFHNELYKGSLISRRGPNASIVRATSSYTDDHEGYARPILSGEARFRKLRRVYNQTQHTTEDFTNANWLKESSGTGSAPTVVNESIVRWDGTTGNVSKVAFNRGAGTTASDTSSLTSPAVLGPAGGTARRESWWLKTADGSTKTLVLLGSDASVSATFTVTGTWKRFAGAITNGVNSRYRLRLVGNVGPDSTAVIYCGGSQSEEVIGQAIQAPSEYVSVGVLSTPYHGAGVDGVRYFYWANGNTVASNVVTEARGADLDLTNAELLPHAAYTSLMLHNRDLTNAAWVKTDSTITANDTASPSGAVDADLVTEGTAGSGQVEQSYTATANTTQTVRRYLKRGNHDWVRVLVYEPAAPTDRVSAWFNLNTGAVGTASNGGTGTGATAYIEPAANGFYLCTLVGAVNNSATALRLAITSASADASATRVNDATRYEWGGVIVNNANQPKAPHVDTGASSVAVNADVVTASGTGIINQLEGTLYVKASPPAVATNNHGAFEIDDTTSNERICLRRDTSGNPLLLVVDGGAVQANVDAGSMAAGSVSRFAGRYRANDFAASINGAAVVTDTSGTVPATSRFYIGGGNFGGTDCWNSGIKVVAYFAVGKGNAELQAIDL